MLDLFPVLPHATEHMEESLYYNALAVAFMGDRAKAAKLRKRYGSWHESYDALKTSVPIPDPDAEWRKLSRECVRLILFEDPEYPSLLGEITDHPFGLYIRGMMPPGGATPFAIVGTRRLTPEGRNTARRFGKELAAAGFPIVSGLAFGADAAAHEGCLDAKGTTVAVLAGGLNDIYPRENARLAENILANGGAIISEYPLGAPPYPDRFLERNRIISGLSRGTLIVEAPFGSGSLATARYAMEENRDVFVIPGPITNPNFAGSHQLIRQGAELVTAPEEILASYGVTREEKIATQETLATDEEMQVIKALRDLGSTADVDKISSITKLEPRIVNRSLSFLLVRGVVKEREGGYTI